MFSWCELLKRPVIIAHRGSSALAPENTLAAFSLALESDADAVELDVQLSKDNQVVVIHDFTLPRTTNGNGRVNQWTLNELKEISAGIRFGKRFTTESIPTLQEVLSLVKGTIGINIELKHIGAIGNGKALVEQTVKLIEEFGAEQSCLLSSFQHQLVQYAFELNPKIARGFLYNSLPLSEDSMIFHSKENSPQFIFCNKYFARKARVSHLHQQGFKVGIYTVNNEHELQKAIRYGAECIFTDNPRLLSQLIRAN